METKSLFITKISSIATVCTVFALWVSVYFSINVENTLGFLLILTIGILHGANDIKLIRNVYKNKSNLSFKKVLFIYIVVVILTALSFFFTPSVALIIFVIISSYHFGEQHFFSKTKLSSLIFKIFCSAYGLIIFSLLFYLNPNDTSVIIYDLTGYQITDYIYKLALIVSLIIFTIIFIYGIFKNKLSVNFAEELFLVILFLVIFKIASLVWAFSIYFIFWHSLPSLKDQIELLYGEYNFNNIKKYILSSLIYWLIAIIGLVFVLLLFRSDQNLFLSLFFAFLAAITIPHVFVMQVVLK
ncbi:MAG: beta-carotene 15,15'-dioxygenase, Brp/Blh family [Flavobacteriaceae bacterium]|nr:Brp/Blh family beta-carotene 15,15'-dioxygenase [Bacteroidia bacterium]NNK81708.1 beta-carotene 15,15'-dioxygenase, Brp/Blh family [Flavobacteriaceae bacterium]